MTVLTSTKRRTENNTAFDDDIGFAHVGPSIEISARVTLTTTIKMVLVWIARNGIKNIWYTNGAAFYQNGTLAADVGDFVTAIDRSKDMAALDFNKSIAVYITCRTAPNARRDGIIATTAAEYLPEESVAVSTNGRTGLVVLIGRVINIIPVVI